MDIAGTGDNYGQFDDEYSEQELTDGEAVLNWISSRDRCDGSIGMIGITWGGFNALQLAFRRPSSLKAIVTVASTTDCYADDIHYMGGCLLSDDSNWGATMLAFSSCKQSAVAQLPIRREPRSRASPILRSGFAAS